MKLPELAEDVAFVLVFIVCEIALFSWMGVALFPWWAIPINLIFGVFLGTRRANKYDVGGKEIWKLTYDDSKKVRDLCLVMQLNPSKNLNMLPHVTEFAVNIESALCRLPDLPENKEYIDDAKMTLVAVREAQSSLEDAATIQSDKI